MENSFLTETIENNYCSAGIALSQGGGGKEGLSFCPSLMLYFFSIISANWEINGDGGRNSPGYLLLIFIPGVHLSETSVQGACSSFVTALFE